MPVDLNDKDIVIEYFSRQTVPSYLKLIKNK